VCKLINFVEMENNIQLHEQYIKDMSWYNDRIADVMNRSAIVGYVTTEGVVLTSTGSAREVIDRLTVERDRYARKHYLKHYAGQANAHQ